MARRPTGKEGAGLPDAVLAKVDVRDREAIARAVAEAGQSSRPRRHDVRSNAGIARRWATSPPAPRDWGRNDRHQHQGVMNSVMRVGRHDRTQSTARW